jgi:hypothetical protein
MADILFDGGYVTNLAVLIITVGYLAVGLIFGYVWGSDRAERRAFAREFESREYWRSYYSHPSNR